MHNVCVCTQRSCCFADSHDDNYLHNISMHTCDYITIIILTAYKVSLPCIIIVIICTQPNKLTVDHTIWSQQHCPVEQCTLLNWFPQKLTETCDNLKPPESHLLASIPAATNFPKPL